MTPLHNGPRNPEANKTRPTICVDMDEVIADALGEHLLRYNRDFSERITRADLNGQWLWDFVPPERQLPPGEELPDEESAEDVDE